MGVGWWVLEVEEMVGPREDKEVWSERVETGAGEGEKEGLNRPRSRVG